MALGFSDKASAQETSVKQQLAGSWIFDYNASMNKMEDASKRKLDNMTTDFKNRVENNYKGRIITFKENGDYEQVLANGHRAIGTWKLSKNQRTVLITDPDGMLHKQKIKSLSDGQLVLKPMLEGEAKMLISEWNFIKSKN